MSTTHTNYTAVIPQIFFEDSGVRHLLALMNMNKRGLAQVNEFGAHFEVEEIDGGESYWCEGLDHDISDSIERLIADNKICLVYKYEWDSGGDFDDQEVPFDPVALVDRVPTLVLREVLAKRLAE